MTEVDELKTAAAEGREEGSSKMEFSPEQQARVQELIDGAYRRAYSKATATTGESEEMVRLKGEVERLHVESKNAALIRAVSRFNVVDPEEVMELISSKVSVGENGMLSVADDDGSGRRLGAEEYLTNWLAERPHHLRSSGSTGSGSHGSKFAEKRQSYNLTDPAAWRELPREELDRLLKEGVNVQGSSGQVYRFKDVKNPFVEARRRKFSKRS